MALNSNWPLSSLTSASRICLVKVQKPDNDRVSQEKGRRTIEHSTQAIFYKSHVDNYMHPEIAAGFVGWWEQQELCKASKIMPRAFVNRRRVKLTHFVFAVVWQLRVQLSTWFNHRILANLGPLAPSRLDTEIGMIQRLKSF